MNGIRRLIDWGNLADEANGTLLFVIVMVERQSCVKAPKDGFCGWTKLRQAPGIIGTVLTGRS
jgi:hypothetical protein